MHKSIANYAVMFVLHSSPSHIEFLPSVFEYFAMENKKRWIEDGEIISEEIIRDVMEEVERERQQQEEGLDRENGEEGELSNGCL